MTPLLSAPRPALACYTEASQGRRLPASPTRRLKRDARTMGDRTGRAANHGVRDAAEKVQDPARTAMGTHGNQIEMAFLGHAANLGGGIAPYDEDVHRNRGLACEVL